MSLEAFSFVLPTSASDVLVPHRHRLCTICVPLYILRCIPCMDEKVEPHA